MERLPCRKVGRASCRDNGPLTRLVGAVGWRERLSGLALLLSGRLGKLALRPVDGPWSLVDPATDGCDVGCSHRVNPPLLAEVLQDPGNPADGWHKSVLVLTIV